MTVPKLPLYLTGTLARYHLWWWRRQNRTCPILTDWNFEHRAIFVHIPKTAGTSVFRIIGAQPLPDTHPPSLAYHRVDPAFFRRAYKFTFVRNPWDRFASSFAFMTEGTDWEMQRAWARRNIGALDFRAFTRKLKQPWFRAIVASERFFWPQSFWLEGAGGDCRLDDVFRFEALAPSVERLCARLGRAVPAVLPHERPSARPAYRSLYDDEMIDIVASFYRKDIRRFGYEF